MVPELTPFEKLISFTRTSAATYVNSAGNIVTTPASKNLLTFTEEFANAAWTKTDTTVTANNALAPDGNSTADTLTEGSAGTGQVGATGSVPSAGATATYSIYLKRGNTDWVRIQVFNGANGFRAWFNLGTGAVGTAGAVGTGSLTGASIASAGDGWYRCILTGAIPSASAYSAFTNTASADNSSTRVSGGDYLAWGAQLETGSTATSYVRNFGGLFPPRFDYDPVTLQPRGLLIEEQRTNLLTYSKDWTNAAWSKTNITVTSAATTSPDGTVDAQKIEATATAATSVITPTATVAATSTTFSVYVKQGTGATTAGTFTLRNITSATNLIRGTLNYSTGAFTYTAGSTGVTVTNAGNGWWRIVMTATSGITSGDTIRGYVGFDGGPQTAGDHLFAWGAQLEAGSFATSYIPTVASQVTRTVDRASIVAPNFAPWYNQSEGTFVVEFDTSISGAPPVTAYMIALDASGSKRIAYIGSGSELASTFDGSTILSAAGDVTGPVSKTAMAYSPTERAISSNGQAATTGAVAAGFSSASSLDIGSAGSGGQLNGHIRRISYYPSRLSNAQLQALSA